MASIRTYTNNILTNIASVDQRTTYFYTVLSLIEQSSEVKFTNDDEIIMSTAEHYGVYNHYKTLSNTLTIAFEASKKYKDRNIYFVVLADSLIPLDNADYPRGIIINLGEGKIEKKPLFTKQFNKSFPLYLNKINQIPKDFPINNEPFGQSIILLKIKEILKTKKKLF